MQQYSNPEIPCITRLVASLANSRHEISTTKLPTSMKHSYMDNRESQIVLFRFLWPIMGEQMYPLCPARFQSAWFSPELTAMSVNKTDK